MTEVLGTAGDRRSTSEESNTMTQAKSVLAIDLNVRNAPGLHDPWPDLI